MKMIKMLSAAMLINTAIFASSAEDMPIVNLKRKSMTEMESLEKKIEEQKRLDSLSSQPTKIGETLEALLLHTYEMMSKIDAKFDMIESRLEDLERKMASQSEESMELHDLMLQLSTKIEHLEKGK